MTSQYESNSTSRELQPKCCRYPLAILVLIAGATAGLIGLLGLLVAF